MKEIKGNGAVVLICLAPCGRSSFHALRVIGMGCGNGLIWYPGEGILRKQVQTEKEDNLEKYARAANSTSPFCAGEMRILCLCHYAVFTSKVGADCFSCSIEVVFISFACSFHAVLFFLSFK